MPQGLTSLLWFAAIIVLIPIALWLLKRTPLGGTGGFGAQASAGVPRHVAMLSLSPSQRIVTIEVGQGEAREWLVLGVTAQNISTLHRMAALAETPQTAAPMPGFAQLLARLRRDAGHAATTGVPGGQ